MACERPSGSPPICSFCRKSQDEVERLLACPGVAICAECIELCADILAAARRKEKAEAGFGEYAHADAIRPK